MNGAKQLLVENRCSRITQLQVDNIYIGKLDTSIFSVMELNHITLKTCVEKLKNSS